MKDVLIRRAGAWLFLLTLVVRIGLIFGLGSYRYPERTEVVNIAMALAQKGEFADAYGAASGPTAHTTPVYALLLSCIFRIFGTGQAGEIGQEIFSSIIASIICGLLPSVAFALGLSRSTGIWAGLWAALLPVNYWSETKGSFESTLTALALLLLSRHFALVWTRGQFSPREACTGGAFAGVAALISSATLPVTALLMASGAWLFREKKASYARYVGIFAGVTIAVIVPWAIRNQYALGSPIFTRSNLGLELLISNNDSSHADYNNNAADHMFQRYHPYANEDARREQVRIGEVAFEHQRMEQAISWISSHPGRFAELTLGRFALFWFPRMARTVQTILIRLEAIAGIVGFCILLRATSRAKWIIGALWIGYPVVYYFIQAFPRYRYPIDWSFVLLGSFAAGVLLTRSFASSDQVS